MPYYATNLDNVRLYYEDRGSGQPIVFVHGWSASGKLMLPIMEGLRGKYRCISYDHRGHGASSLTAKGLTMDQLARDLRELIDYLGLKDVVLVGHSMGAATIYDYIGQFGCGNVKKCVFIDMSPKLLNDAEWKFGYQKAPYDLPKLISDIELMNQDFGAFLLRFFGEVLPMFAAIPPEMAPVVGPGLLGANDALILKSLWFSMFLADHRPAVEKLTVPALYFIPDGGLYPMGAPEYIRGHARAPVEIVTVEGATHMAPVEQPMKFVAEIDRFVSGGAKA